MIKTIVNGASGAMGKHVLNAIEKNDDFELVAKVDLSGRDGCLKALDEYQGPVDVVIDFSHHLGTKALLDYCISRKLPVVLCTTGQTEEELAMIEDAFNQIPIFRSANMSVGVALLAKLVEEVSAKFSGCDIEIVETHHTRKEDAPSGTAIMLAEAAKKSRPELEIVTGRAGHMKRQPNDITISAVRRGNVVGTHEVYFGTAAQTITLTHEAHDRALFADGAIDAARFLVTQTEARKYDMDDLLK